MSVLGSHLIHKSNRCMINSFILEYKLNDEKNIHSQFHAMLFHVQIKNLKKKDVLQRIGWHSFQLTVVIVHTHSQAILLFLWRKIQEKNIYFI
jgi:hypothetical protein